MKYKVSYPNSEGATSIEGWTWNDHTVINLKPGGEFTTDKAGLANDFVKTYPFCTLLMEEEEVKSKEAEAEEQKERAKELGFPESFPELRKYAKARGVTGNLNREQLIDALVELGYPAKDDEGKTDSEEGVE